MTGTIKHISTSRCVAVSRTALLAACLLWRAFSLIWRATAVALLALRLPELWRSPGELQGSSSSSELWKQHHVTEVAPLAWLMRAGSCCAHTDAHQDPQWDVVCAPCLAHACTTLCPSDTDGSSVQNSGTGVQASGVQHSAHTEQCARGSQNTHSHRHVVCSPLRLVAHTDPSLKPDSSTCDWGFQLNSNTLE